MLIPLEECDDAYPAEKVLEDSDLVEFDQTNKVIFFLIVASPDKMEESIRFLKAHLDVFALSPYEVPSVDPDFIFH